MQFSPVNPELDARMAEPKFLFNQDPSCGLPNWARVVSVQDRGTLAQCMQATYQTFNPRTGETGPHTPCFRDASKKEIEAWEEGRKAAIERRNREVDDDRVRNSPTIVVRSLEPLGVKG